MTNESHQTESFNLPSLSPCVRKWKDLHDPNDKPTFNSPFNLFKDANDVYKRIQENFTPRQSDVYIINYPKQGTTWTTQIIRKLRDLDAFGRIRMTESIQLGLFKEEDIPWLEIQANYPDFVDNLNYFDKIPKSVPRYFKSHSPVGLIPRETFETTKKLKSILIIRNPLDQIVSAWHHHRSKFFFQYQGSFQHFFEQAVLSNNIENGNWFTFHEEYLQEYQENGENNEFLILKYEDMMADNGYEAIKSLAKFLNLDKFLSDVEVETIEDIKFQSSFKTMSEIANKNGFFKTIDRKKGNGIQSAVKDDLGVLETGDKNSPSSAQMRLGKVKGWKDYFTVHQLEMWKHFAEKQMESSPKLVELLGKEYILGQ